MKAKKKAKKVKKEKRTEEAFKYLNKATEKQKEAAEGLGKAIDDFNDTMKEVIKNANPEHSAQIANLNSKISKLLNEAKQGKDINEIVSKLKKL